MSISRPVIGNVRMFDTMAYNYFSFNVNLPRSEVGKTGLKCSRKINQAIE
jgi:hypothetical protein